MHFHEKLRGDIKLLETIYDLAAYCYDYLINLVSANQAIFIASYLWENNESDKNNPNLELARVMQQDIKELILNKDNVGIMFEDYHEEFCNLIYQYENQLQDFGEDNNLNHAIIPFFIIKGLELYRDDKQHLTYKRAPLNESYRENSYVYLNEPCELALNVAKEVEFGRIITANEIRNEINGFIFLEKKDVQSTYGLPNVVTLNKDSKIIGEIFEKQTINIAVIPFSCERMLDFPIRQGATFEVKYEEWHIQNAKERALKLLDKAIENGANIVVFPEFVCSPEIQDAISNKLKLMCKRADKKLKDLLLVVAGSGWTEDSNNVSKIYSYNGIHLGDQYKYSSFSKDKNMMEGLNNPGKATTIIRIPKIGCIQVGICRDISESAFSKQLARIFSPAFLLIPAWSTSVARGFKTQLQTIIAENHTTSAVLCNCCEAFRDLKLFRENIGIIMTPYMNETVVEGRKTSISRKRKICKKCSEYGCVFMCAFDFSLANDDKGIFVHKPDHIFCNNSLQQDGN